MPVLAAKLETEKQCKNVITEEVLQDTDRYNKMLTGLHHPDL